MTIRGNTQYATTTRIAPELVLKLRKIIARDGVRPTAERFKAAETTLYKILSHGQIQPATAARLSMLLEEMT